MEDRSYTLPEDLILARQANLLRSFYKLVAALTSVALILIAFLPGFATSESVIEPFVRNVFVLLTIGTLYYLVQRDQVLAGIYGTILMCAVFASYSIYMESPGNMQMFTLIIFPTCVAGLLPTRPQFWLVYILNIALMLVTMWMVINYKGVGIEYRSIVTLGMLHTLIALLIDTMSSSYRDSIRTTFNQLVEIQAAEQRLLELDADLDVAVSEKIRAEHVSNQLEKTGRLALEVAGAGSITINKIDGSVEASEDFMQRCNFSTAPTTLDDLINCIHPQDRSRFEELIREGAQTRQRLEAEFRAVSDEALYWLLLLEVNRDTSGAENSLSGIIVDVTQRALEQQRQHARDNKLHESQRLESLGVLAGAIAHDFNNLLHVIMLNADLARKELKPDSKPAISIDRLLTTVDRAAELCSELLAYSGKGNFTIEPFAAEKLVTEMRSLFEISTPKGLEIEYETDSSNPLINGDITQIRQVVMNFITNAGEAIGSSNGKMTLSVSTRYCDEKYLESGGFVEEIEPGEFACISVEDNGCGMEPAIIKRMFDPFFSTKESGHGLGLSAALGIIRGHNGTISVESVVDKGTKITMLLPLSDEASVVVPATPDPEPATSSKGIILFADDEDDIRSLAEAVLADCGYTVLQARDGNEALEIFKNRHEELQLVILDLIMPNKTGLECYLEIAELDASVPVVFSSGFNEGDALKDLPKSTQSAFLKKPYLAEDLRKFVEGFVR